MRALAVLAGTLAAFAALPAAADETRLALVIGNEAYDSLRPLKNAVSEAGQISGALDRAGFEVSVVPNANRSAMEAALSDFRQRLVAAGPDAVGLFYFAGHRIELSESGYLMAVDAPTKPSDIPEFGFATDDVLRSALKGGGQSNFAIRDACAESGTEADGGKGAKGGAPIGGESSCDVVMLWSSALAGAGASGNAQFARNLAENLARPDVSVEDLLARVAASPAASASSKGKASAGSRGAGKRVGQ